MKKKLLAIVLGLAMVLCLVACGSTTSTETTAAATEKATEEATEAVTEVATEVATEAETTVEETTEEETVALKGSITIGHLLDKTGVEAITGECAKMSLDFAVEYVEAKTGWHFDVIEGDCAGDAATATNAAEQLVAQGAKVLVGPTQVDAKKAVLMAAYECPVVLYNGSPYAFTSGLALQGATTDYICANGGATAGFPSVMADYCYNELGLRKVYSFKQESVGGNNYVDPFVTCFEALGGEVINHTALSVAKGTNDWSGYLTEMKNSGAEAIVGWTSSSDAIAFFKEWYNSGAYETMPVIATMHGGFSDSYVMDELDDKIVEALIDGGLCAPICYSYTIDTEANKEFVEAWEEEFDEVPLGNNLPGATVQALLAIAYALDEVGIDADAKTLAEAIRNTEFDGPEGHTVYSDYEGGAEGSATVAVKDVYVCNVVDLGDSYNYEVVKVYEQVSNNGYNFDQVTGSYTGK